MTAGQGISASNFCLKLLSPSGPADGQTDRQIDRQTDSWREKLAGKHRYTEKFETGDLGFFSCGKIRGNDERKVKENEERVRKISELDYK